jgi:hypothetical protein
MLKLTNAERLELAIARLVQQFRESGLEESLASDLGEGLQRVLTPEDMLFAESLAREMRD